MFRTILALEEVRTARDVAAGTRMVSFHQLQEDELALVVTITAQWLLLIRVRQRWSLWMRPRSRAFFKDVVPG